MSAEYEHMTDVIVDHVRLYLKWTGSRTKIGEATSKAILDCVKGPREGPVLRLMVKLISFVMGDTNIKPINNDADFDVNLAEIAFAVKMLLTRHKDAALVIFNLVSSALGSSAECEAVWANELAILDTATLEILLKYWPNLTVSAWTYRTWGGFHAQSGGPFGVEFVAQAMPFVASQNTRIECIVASLALKSLNITSQLLMAHIDSLYPNETGDFTNMKQSNEPGFLAILYRMALDDEKRLPGETRWTHRLNFDEILERDEPVYCHLEAKLTRIKESNLKMSTLAAISGSAFGGASWVPFGPDYDEKIQNYKLELGRIVNESTNIGIEGLTRIIVQFVQ